MSFSVVHSGEWTSPEARAALAPLALSVRAREGRDDNHDHDWTIGKSQERRTEKKPAQAREPRGCTKDENQPSRHTQKQIPSCPQCLLPYETSRPKSARTRQETQRTGRRPCQSWLNKRRSTFFSNATDHTEVIGKESVDSGIAACPSSGKRRPARALSGRMVVFGIRATTNLTDHHWGRHNLVYARTWRNKRRSPSRPHKEQYRSPTAARRDNDGRGFRGWASVHRAQCPRCHSRGKQLFAFGRGL